MKATTFDVQETFRQAVETGMERARSGYDGMKASAEGMTSAIEARFTNVTADVAALNTKAVEIFRNEALSAFDFFQSLMLVKSPQEALALQMRHVYESLESAGSHSRDVAHLVQKIATDAAAPIAVSPVRGSY